MAMNFTLRKAIIGDSDFLLNLRNEEGVRKASFNQEPIKLESHSKWFQNKLKDENTQIFIVEVESRPMAMVRFDLIGDADAEVNIAVTGKFQGKGYGSEILISSAGIFFEAFPLMEKIHAFIKPDNQASISSFSKAGFRSQGEVVYEGHSCMLMILTR